MSTPSTPTFPTGDYVLGTDVEELRRLGIQHDVWREEVARAFDAAPVRPGDDVIDLGCGPGYVALDLARRVGPAGSVLAIDRSPRFLADLRRSAVGQGLTSIVIEEGDAATIRLDAASADLVWIRWLLCFVDHPEAVLERAVAALRPGGRLVTHEYAAYECWRMMPPSAALDRFVAQVMQSWRATGGEPNVATRLPAALERLGLSKIRCRPIVMEGGAGSPPWAWLAGFVQGNLARRRDLGVVGGDEAQALASALRTDFARPGARMLSPLVLEVTAQA